MNRLNAAISAIPGLNASYHIGGAYFLDTQDYADLWRSRLEPLLKEYLRGMPEAEAKLEAMKAAYENDGQ